jgi:glyoxylase-like metal-dependent hydrolase (beta-lactamase superfamily II)
MHTPSAELLTADSAGTHLQGFPSMVGVDLVQLLPDLYFLRMPIGHVYLWRDFDGLTLIDSGVPGSAAPIADAIRALGHDPAEVRRLVLTHAHADHTGSAAEIAEWGGVTVLAHRAEAPAIRGQESVPAPRLADWEKPILERVSAEMPAVPTLPVRVDRELEDGDVIEFGGGAVVLAIPGHTPGSIAVHLPQAGVLFTGDTLARDPRSRDGRAPVFAGLFNVDIATMSASIRRLATIDADIACFGHGEPVTARASARIQAAAQRLAH